MAVDFVTNQEIILEARRNLDQGAWDYLVGGSESETTMRRNRMGFDCLAFKPRVLRDVSEVDASTTLLGHPLRIPVVLSPMGSIILFSPEGALPSARAAEAFGTIHVVSSGAEPGLERIGSSTKAPKIFQLNATADLEAAKEKIEGAAKAGYVALAWTVDHAASGRRERPMLGRTKSNAMERFRAKDKKSRPNWRAMATWETLDRVKEMAGRAGLPFLVKGIATAADAALAVEHGVDVVWVSNHGGRNLDHGRGTIEVLPEVVEAVAGRAAVVLDGGIQRGSDVLKAIALGATAVGIGKLQGFGIGAAGAEGVFRVLEILEDEIEITMAFLGVNRIDQLGPEYLCEAKPVTFPHEMSQFVNLIEGQIR